MNMITKVGYTRAGRLDTFYSVLPADAPPLDELKLDEMAAAGADKPCLIYKPHANYCLLVGVHHADQDRAAPIVAGRLLPRATAEKLLRSPDLLLRYGLFLQQESAENVAAYRDSVPIPENDELQALPALAEKWAVTNASGDNVRLILQGFLNAALSKQNRPIQFITASGAALHRALRIAPSALTICCGFSIPFNREPGALTDLCLCADAADAADAYHSYGNGWPARERLLLSSGTKVKQELEAAAEELLSWNAEDRSRWEELYGDINGAQTARLITALGVVRRMDKRLKAAVELTSMGWSKQEAAASIRALEPFLGPEPPGSEPESEPAALPPVPEEGGGRREASVLRLLASMGVLTLLIAATALICCNVGGLVHKTVRFTFTVEGEAGSGAALLILFGMALGMLLEKLLQALKKRIKGLTRNQKRRRKKCL